MSNKISILLVDDNEDILAANRRIFQAGGYEIRTAASGNEGLDKLNEQLSDILLLDVVLPDISGIDLCRSLKELPEFKHLYIILLSSLKKSSDQQAEGLEAGADGYIGRPVTDRELLARVEAYARIIKAERFIESQKRYYQSILASMDDGIIATEQNDRVVFVNKKAIELTGFSESTVTGRALPEILKLESVSGHSCFPEFGSADTGSSQNKLTECVLISAAGQRIPIELSVVHLPGMKGHISERVIVLRDLSLKKLLEQRFIRTQRNESAKIMAGGIAHNLNNILAPVLLAGEMLQSETEVDSELIKTVQKHILRAKDLIWQVLAVTHGYKLDLVDVDITDLITQTVSEFRNLVPAAIRIDLQLSETKWNLKADPDQIKQALENLLSNARNAITDEGLITIETSSLQREDAGHLDLPEQSASRYLRINIIDNGAGIEDIHKNRLFDPFFTTRETGSGIGLGLSTVQAIMKNHSGIIEFESTAGKGSSFSLFLPLSDA